MNSKRANLEWNTGETNQTAWGGRLSLFVLDVSKRSLYDRIFDSDVRWCAM